MKKLLLSTVLIAGSAAAADEPYKVCPLPLQEKDAPCVVSKKTMAITIRGLHSEDRILKNVHPIIQDDTIKDKEIEQLKLHIEALEKENQKLSDDIQHLQQLIIDLSRPRIYGEGVLNPSEDDKDN